MGRNVAARTNYDGLESIASTDPQPWEVASDRERRDEDRPPTVL